jgi:hypothetical protein
MVSRQQPNVGAGWAQRAIHSKTIRTSFGTDVIVFMHQCSTSAAHCYCDVLHDTRG